MTNRRLLYRYKGDQCTYCGLSVADKWKSFQTLRGFELHHIDPTKKSPDYDNLIRRNFSSEQLDETDKCVLLCSNCHDTLHGQNLVAELRAVLTAPDIEPIHHTLTCQVICDSSKQEVMLFCEDLDYLELFRIRLGTALCCVESGIQLKANGRLDELIERTKKEGPLQITRMNGRPVISASRISDEEVSIQVCGDSPFLKAKLEFANTDGDTLDLHARMGHLIADFGKDNQLISRLMERMTLTVTSPYKS